MTHPSKPKKIVLAYSGGLDTSVMLRWLIEKHQCPVIAFAADVGQDEDLKALEEKAVQTGAAEVFVEDLRDKFVREYVFTALKANAVYEGSYLMGTALARPLIALGQVELAQRLGAQAVAHGATGKGNDQVRFELTYQALAPDLDIIAPWRDWEFTSRSDLIDYARRHGIEISATVEKPYSIDRNLMHVSYEGGILEDPWLEPPEDMFTMTRAPERAPEEPAYVLVDFEKGVPVALNEQHLEPVALLEEANRLAGRHGIGRVDLVENRFVGIKSRGVYETPGMTLLHAAHRAIESITLDREVLHLRDSLTAKNLRADLLRVLVLAGVRTLARFSGFKSEERHRNGSNEVVQGRLSSSGPPFPRLALLPSASDLRRGLSVPAQGCRRIHSAQRFAASPPSRAGRSALRRPAVEAGFRLK